MVNGRIRARWRKVLMWAVLIVVVAASSPFAARGYLHHVAKDRISSDVADAPHRRVALVLGAKIYPSGHLSTLLRDRVDTAVGLYKAGKCEKLLMSGDNRFSHYNEPDRMREYAVSKGVPPGDIACDYAGRRTYDSMYRAKHIFGLGETLIVSQSFHLDRAIFLCDRLGIDGHGVSADVDSHFNLPAVIREFPACIRAFIDAYAQHPAQVMGKRERI